MLLGFLKLLADCECPASKIFLRNSFKIFLRNSFKNICPAPKIFLKLPADCECHTSKIFLRNCFKNICHISRWLWMLCVKKIQGLRSSRNKIGYQKNFSRSDRISIILQNQVIIWGLHIRYWAALSRKIIMKENTAIIFIIYSWRIWKLIWVNIYSNLLFHMFWMISCVVFVLYYLLLFLV